MDTDTTLIIVLTMNYCCARLHYKCCGVLSKSGYAHGNMLNTKMSPVIRVTAETMTGNTRQHQTAALNEVYGSSCTSSKISWVSNLVCRITYSSKDRKFHYFNIWAPIARFCFHKQDPIVIPQLPVPPFSKLLKTNKVDPWYKYRCLEWQRPQSSPE